MTEYWITTDELPYAAFVREGSAVTSDSHKP